MNGPFKSRHFEPLGLNRPFLFLLVVGMFFVALQRNKDGPKAVPAGTVAPATGAKPAKAPPTNSTPEHSLVSVEQPIHK